MRFNFSFPIFYPFRRRKERDDKKEERQTFIEDDEQAFQSDLDALMGDFNKVGMDIQNAIIRLGITNKNKE